MKLFSFAEARLDRVQETLDGFPSDLVELVLSAPAAVAIAAHPMHFRRKK
jgi:hypothetical protein